MQRWIMHIDMDAFYASVEQLDNPEIRGLPVIVGGMSNRGVVSTASYEARAFGVHSALPITTARQLCPQGIFIQGNYSRYEEVSARIMAIFNKFSPLVQPLSIDEAFLDLTGMEGIISDLKEYAYKLKTAIKQETGLTASAGIGPNKFLAKIASDYKKPDGFFLIAQEEVNCTTKNGH